MTRDTTNVYTIAGFSRHLQNLAQGYNGSELVVLEGRRDNWPRIEFTTSTNGDMVKYGETEFDQDVFDGGPTKIAISEDPVIPSLLIVERDKLSEIGLSRLDDNIGVGSQ